MTFLATLNRQRWAELTRLPAYQEGRAACYAAAGWPCRLAEVGGIPYERDTIEREAWSLGWNQVPDYELATDREIVAHLASCEACQERRRTGG